MINKSNFFLIFEISASIYENVAKLMYDVVADVKADQWRNPSISGKFLFIKNSTAIQSISNAPSDTKSMGLSDFIIGRRI